MAVFPNWASRAPRGSSASARTSDCPGLNTRWWTEMRRSAGVYADVSVGFWGGGVMWTGGRGERRSHSNTLLQFTPLKHTPPIELERH
eukprot:3687813-Rhodomonas_salina.1